MKPSLRLLFSILFSVMPIVHAYDLRTHATLTRHAYDRSLIGSDLRVVTNLGIGQYVVDLKNGYYDLRSTEERPNSYFATAFEFGNGVNSDDYSALSWLQRGAIREDDQVGIINLLSGAPNPQVLPEDGLNRFCNHFFDPYNARALTPVPGSQASTFCPAAENRNAQEWATSPSPRWRDLVQLAQSYRNHFTVVHAREYMWRALTLTRYTSGTYQPLYAVNSAPAELQRVSLRYWASVFKSLGHVVHLAQDAAQPQHARNEDHPAFGRKVYEAYIEKRMQEQKFCVSRDPLVGPCESFVVPAMTIDQTYPVPAFPDYKSFWSTENASVLPRSSVITGGRGLSDYSNRGFLTPQYGLGNTEYPSPSPSPASYSPQEETSSADPAHCSYAGPIGPITWRYLIAPVEDFQRPGTSLIRMASTGLLDSALAAKGAGVGDFGFNKCTMESRANLLLPRAVAYSAGLINHFFRGQLAISPPAEGAYAVADHSLAEVNIKDSGGFKKVKLKVKNLTPNIVESGTGISHPQNLDANGDVVAVARFRRNRCYEPIRLAGEIGAQTPNQYNDQQGTPLPTVLQNCYYVSGTTTLAPEEIVISNVIKLGQVLSNGQSSADLTFSFETAIPINAMDLTLQVVYRGQLGKEDDAVVVGTQDISEPTYFSFENHLDCEVSLNADTAQYSVSCQPPASVSGTLERQVAFADPAQGGQAAVQVSVPAAKFARVAALLPTNSTAYWLSDGLGGYVVGGRPPSGYAGIGAINQFDVPPDAQSPDNGFAYPMTPGRKTVVAGQTPAFAFTTNANSRLNAIVCTPAASPGCQVNNLPRVYQVLQQLPPYSDNPQIPATITF